MAQPGSPQGTPSRIAALWLRQARDQAFISMDAAGTIVEWLGGAETLLGYSAADAVGKPISLIFSAEDRAKGGPEVELACAGQDRAPQDSRWHVRKDGTRIWATGSVTAVRDERGQLLGFVKVLRDTTDQRTDTERFEHEVSELGSARDETRTFLRTLGHEIRNPLAVLGNVRLILERTVEDPRGRKAIRQLDTQLEVLRRLADDLMDVTRLELGKVKLDRKPVDLYEVLRDAVDSMQETAAEKSIALESVLPPSALTVEVDLARIHQVIYNLLNNAIKYTHEGGSIWVRANQEGNEVVCRVQDTGIGIVPPALPRIFEPFTQAPEGETMRSGGVGLGLTLVRQLVELHGGSAQAQSPGLGKGSEFSFRLPVGHGERPGAGPA